MTSRRVWIFAASFWAVFGLISGVQVWISMITHGHSVPLLVGYHIVVWEGWLLPTMLIVWLTQRWPIIPPRARSIAIHFVAACFISVLHCLWWLALLIAMRPYDRMTAEPSELRIQQILFARMPLEWTLYCLVLGAAIAYDYYERYRERTVKTAQLEASLSEARLHALELQIQPHFLFNTMNAISALVRNRRNDEAVTMLAGLSDLLRYTLDRAGQHRVPLEEELAVLRRYLEIQHMRFPDRMSFTIDATPEVARAAVPALLLQPLAENAVRHGIDGSASAGEVQVRAFRSGESLRIEIFNSGSLAESPRNGIGLHNTRERLGHLYGDCWTFSLKNAGGGVLASLSIPLERGGVNEPLRIIIVDDEPLARDSIRVLLENEAGVRVAGEASGVDAAALIARTRPDIMFLDIQMPQVDGFTLLDQIGADAVPAIVFVTAYDRYALRAFEVHALDYLLKPFDDRRFAQALAHAKERALGRRRGETDARIAELLAERAAPARSRFLVPVRDRTIVIDAADIDWIEAADYYVSLHVTENGAAASHLLRQTMDEIEKQLDPRQFFRVHRSAIVNIDRVREIHPLFRGDCALVLADGRRLKLSRSRRGEFEALFAQPRRK